MQDNEPLSRKDKSLKIFKDTKSDLSRYRKQFEPNWKDEENSYFGQIWEASDGYRPYENHIFPVIQQQLAVLTDSLPSVSIEVSNPEFQEQAKILQKANEYVLEKQNFPILLEMLIQKSLISGPSYFYGYYDPNADNGQGQIINECLSWDQVWLDQNALTIENAERALIKLYRSKNWLKNAFPDFEEEIEEEESSESGIDEDDDDFNISENYDTGSSYAQRTKPKRVKDKNTLELYITYVKDYSKVPISEEESDEELTEESAALEKGESPDVSKYQDHEYHNSRHEPVRQELYLALGANPEEGFEAAQAIVEQIMQQDPENEEASSILLKIKLLESHMEEHEVLSEENPSGKKLKYPGALRVIKTVGEIVLYDGEYEGSLNEIPLSPFWTYRDGSIYGHGEIRNILDSQRMHAIMSFKQYKAFIRVSNPAKLLDKKSGLKPRDIKNEEGAIYPVNEGSFGIKEIPPGTVSPQIPSFLQGRQEAIVNISGQVEASENAELAKNQSGIAVDKVQKQQIGRVRLKDRRNQYYSIRRIGKINTSLILDNWSYEKVFAVSDSYGNMEEYFYNPVQMQNIGAEIKVSQGTMAGVDKDYYNAFLKNFLDSGKITFEQYLQISEVHKKEKLLEAAMENSEVQAQMQELQAQLEQLQSENINLKASINPELLSPEEIKMYQEMQRQKQLQSITGANEGQPAGGI